MGLLHFAIFVVGSVLLAAVRLNRRGTFLKRAGRLGLFLGLLLVVGSVFNGLWSCLVWGRLYFSTDYVFDFSPFWPVTQRVIDAPFGGMRGQLLGVSPPELQLVWLVFAVSTWGVTVLLYRLVPRLSSADQPLQATAAARSR